MVIVEIDATATNSSPATTSTTRTTGSGGLGSNERSIPDFSVETTGSTRVVGTTASRGSKTPLRVAYEIHTTVNDLDSNDPRNPGERDVCRVDHEFAVPYLSTSREDGDQDGCEHQCDDHPVQSADGNIEGDE